MCRLMPCVFSGSILLAATSFVHGAILYAKATGTGNCTTWANACTLTEAVGAAAEHDAIWVQAGTYPPIPLVDGRNVTIIGGFSGTETSASQSKPATNVTAIDGAHASRCVRSVEHDATMVLRGLRFVNGYDGDDFGGGAIYLLDSGPTIVDCVFEYNTAAYVGGAVVASPSGSPRFVNCVFRHNGATTIGGGPYGGGAIFLPEGTLTVVNCLFYDNKAGEGGAVWVGPSSSATFTNCTFAKNEATIRRGGAVYDRAVSSYSNCVFWNNFRDDFFHLPDTYPDQLYETQGATTITYSDVQGGWAGTGNINTDPLFLNAPAGDYGISSSSPCKNAGLNGALPADVGDLDWDGDTGEVLPNDLARNARMVYGSVDMGAYEFFEILQLPPVPEQPPRGPEE
jgi:hypothetical protein